MEEVLGNVTACRSVFERWMEWEPDPQAWHSYINFEYRYKVQWGTFFTGFAPPKKQKRPLTDFRMNIRQNRLLETRFDRINYISLRYLVKINYKNSNFLSFNGKIQHI